MPFDQLAFRPGRPIMSANKPTQETRERNDELSSEESISNRSCREAVMMPPGTPPLIGQAVARS
jgi:hypothetical protein